MNKLLKGIVLLLDKVRFGNFSLEFLLKKST